jgi:hypothetical protein
MWSQFATRMHRSLTDKHCYHETWRVSASSLQATSSGNAAATPNCNVQRKCVSVSHNAYRPVASVSFPQSSMTSGKLIATWGALVRLEGPGGFFDIKH